MAPDGGQTEEEVSTVITCEGTLGHPEFPRQFQKVVDRLNGLLGVPVKVRKLEPWNSVRVTLSVPREAALRLRQLAQQGAAQLRALGILSVQLDGEGAVSLRLQGANGEPQEVVLRTTQDGPSTSSGSLPLGLGALLPTAGGAPGSSASSSQVQFKSPNVVCPPDSVVPRVGASMAAAQGSHAPNPLNKPPYAGPFPFASMNQAIHSQSNNSNSGPASAPRSTNMEPPPPFLPPPYPGVRQSSSTSSQSPNQPPVTISSPLLVNLLQNDHQVGATTVTSSSTSSMGTDLPPPATPSVVRQMRPPPPPQSTKVTGSLPSPSSTVLSSPQVPPVKMSAHSAPSGTLNHLTSQANVLVNSSNNNNLSNSSVSNSSSVSSPSALSTSIASNTSPLMAANSPTMVTSHQTQNQLNSSLVTSTQMAINSIANSLASAANSMTSSSSGGALSQSGMFGLPKSGFAQHSGGVGNQAGVHHYQRTPQGSIIAVNKPLPVSNQLIGTPVQNTIPTHHQVQRPNVSVAQTQVQALLRQQQPITSIPQQKAMTMFTQNNAVSHQNTVVHANQVKMLPTNQNNMMINQNSMTPISSATLLGNSHTLPSNSHTLSGNIHTLSSNSHHMLPGNSHMLSQNSGRAAPSSMGRLGPQPLQQQHQPNLGSLGMNTSAQGQQQQQLLHNNAVLNSVDTLGTQVTSQLTQPNLTKSLPSPPPYSVAISRGWDSLVSNTPNLLDLAPCLSDLKSDDLDDILPTLGHDTLPELSELELLGGPSNSEGPSLNEEGGNSNSNGSSVGAAEPKVVASMENSTNAQDGRKFLINPLTGELEPHSGGESDAEEVKDVFTGLPSPLGLSDEDTSSTVRHDTATDQSDSETRSSNDGKHSRVKNSKVRREGRDSPALKPTEKIKLRLKLEKSEPINPAYKVDVSFINTQLPKKASTSVIIPTTPTSNEELRVPPLHISLRGRNSVVIKNKTKLNPDGTPVVKKVRKMQSKAKKDGTEEEGNREGGEGVNEHRKVKKFKGNHEHKDLLATLTDDPSSPMNAISKYSLHNHYKEKQKERRGSDSELVRANSRKHDANGALVGDEKRRRLSQSEGEKRVEEEAMPSVLGSTNVGTVGVLPQKIRKDKIKIKESFKIKDGNRKLYSTSADKLQQKQASVTLPTAGDVDMEAKFKQSLMEGVMGEKGIPRPPHRTVEQVVHMVGSVRGAVASVVEKVSKNPLDLSQKPALPKEKSPEPDKCNVPERDRKSIDSLQEREKQLNAVVTSGGRSPNSGSSGGQGEDSGIESMDALSEKSPNQASQSPHADILPNVAVPTSKTQVPDMLDIEAQLAKMEGLDHHEAPADPKNHQNTASSNSPGSNSENVQESDRSPNRTTVEDVNENECIHRSDSKSCCDLTCTLQDGLSKGSGKRTQGGDNEEDIVPLNTTKKDDQQLPNSPPALRVAPALYTYPSNPGDKGGGGGQNSRGGSESPSLTTEDEDEDSNLEPSTGQAHVNNKGKSLLEQLLVEIPSEHHGSAATPSSHSPATRSSVRTRALSKLGSPELSSPVPKTSRTAPPIATAKRKRNESDSSNHSVEEARKRPRKGSEASDVGKKVIQPITVNKKSAKGGNVANQTEESSDSDEPLIEKLRKNPPKSNTKVTKVATTQPAPQATSASQINNKTNTRRSARAGHQQEKQEKQQEKQPAQNTRSREKVVQQQQQNNQHQQVAHSNAEAEAALRRKTRSADVESKRKKEVK